MLSPVQSNCDAHDTIASGHETDLPPSAGCGAPVPFADRTIYLCFCRRRTSNTTSPCRLLRIPVVLNDFHSRETTL
ncbi:hypothetical protein TNCV_996261, partial [Trichonephila clavipes]